MTQLATVSQETIDKCRTSLIRLNKAVEGAGYSYNIHAALDGGYDLVLGGESIVYSSTHIKEMLGFMNGMLSHIIDTAITMHLLSEDNPQAKRLFEGLYCK